MISSSSATWALEDIVRQRCRLDICCYIGWIDKYCICQSVNVHSTNITTNTETAALSTPELSDSLTAHERWLLLLCGQGAISLSNIQLRTSVWYSSNWNGSGWWVKCFLAPDFGFKFIIASILPIQVPRIDSEQNVFLDTHPIVLTLTA